MSNFSYDDFAVLVRNFNQGMLTPESLQSLRIVPLSTAPSMTVAIKGDVGLLGSDMGSGANIPAGADGLPIKSNVEVQHNSAGYCRLVGHVVKAGNPEAFTKAKAFVLYRTVEDESEGIRKEVIAVASLKEGFEIGDGCYPSFTITTVNNYQSVAFNPNAFATVEDIKNINGLDGLHIAFDTASGDLKLLDKDGNVLDQANLPIKADVIIAEGEEGYKYVKTDVKQDIHAAKAWMPEGATAWDDVAEAPYELKHAALVVEKGTSTGKVKGITLGKQSMYTFEEGATTPSEFKDSSGQDVRWFGTKPIPEGYTLKYGLEAFVWTVKGAGTTISDPFFQQLNDSLLDLGFHEGDDIALGTNLSILAPAEGVSPLNKVDANEYMHGKDNKALREREVNAQRANAKEELVAWNAQHPALAHNEVAGTRISSDGVDIRDGKILIGDGIGLGKDDVKHYELSTNFKSGVDSKDEGLALTVLDASGGALPRNVLTISDSSYISGAPICMALSEVTEEVTEQGGALRFETKRRTACFECEMVEADGTVNITITDKRLNSKGFATTFGARDDCIVEISPVYIPSNSASDSNSAPEMLPALNMVNTVATVGSTVVAEGTPYKMDKLTCTCPQIIDWANSVNISAEQNPGNRMFVIVKVY